MWFILDLRLSVKELVLSHSILQIDSNPLKNCRFWVMWDIYIYVYIYIWIMCDLGNENVTKLCLLSCCLGVWFPWRWWACSGEQCWAGKISAPRVPMVIARPLPAFSSWSLQTTAALTAHGDCCHLHLRQLQCPACFCWVGRACSGFVLLWILSYRAGGLRLGGAAGNVSSK